MPPERMLRSFSYSAFAAACFSSSVGTLGRLREGIDLESGSSRMSLRRPGVRDLLGRRSGVDDFLRRRSGEGDLLGERSALAGLVSVSAIFQNCCGSVLDGL